MDQGSNTLVDPNVRADTLLHRASNYNENSQTQCHAPGIRWI